MSLGKVGLVLAILAVGCGTGPWFIAPKNYTLYTQPVVRDPASATMPKTEGSYKLITSPEKSWWRTSLRFDADGGVLKLDSIYLKDGIQVSVTNGWYAVTGDSMHIEYFAPHRRQMFAMVYREHGRVGSDSALRMAFGDQPGRVREFRWTESKVMAPPELPMYEGKKWYRKGLHPARH